MRCGSKQDTIALLLHTELQRNSKTNVLSDMLSGCIEYQDLRSLVFERLFYSGYVAMAKIRFTEFLPSTGCHHSVCPHYRHLARP